MRFSNILKGKKKYLAIMIGLLMVGGVTYSTKNIKEAGDKLANISKARNSLEENLNNEISSNYALNKEDILDDEYVKNSSKENGKENEEVQVKVEKETVEVISNNQDGINEKTKKEKYSFNEEDGLSWPVKGDIIKNYSIDKLVYFDTLGVFKANPGIFIQGREGQEVKASCNGRVVKLGEDLDRGKYIEMEIGNGFTLMYGQLKDIKVVEGEDIKEGQVIAFINKPTAYYTKEGTHLYFQIEENDKEINPLILLK